MKKIIIALALTTGYVSVRAQEHTVQITPVVQSAVVYLDGAELYHTKQIALNAGRTLVTFNGVSSKLISKSIQVTTSGEVNILSVTDKLNYSTTAENSPKAKLIKDSILLLNDNVTLLNMDREAYEIEKSMLDKNQAIGGQDKGVAIAELKLAADFYRSRMKEINAEFFKIDKKTNQYNASLAKLNKELRELNGTPKGPMAEITVLVASAVKQNVTIDLKYLVSDAGWAPSYDIVTEDVNTPINLKYRAKVYNNTDVEWKNIKLKLSTGDPMKSASKPELADWYLNFNTPAENNIGGKRNSYKSDMTQQSLSSQNLLNSAPIFIDGEVAIGSSGGKNKSAKYELKKQVEQPKVQLEEIEVSDLSAEFDIKTEYSVPSDAKPYIIDVTAYNLPATYSYFSVPKEDKSAFMLARITGWEALELVPGNANVYLGDRYVGQSYINTKSTNDTLDLSIGRDNKIMVSRAQLKDFNTEKIIGNNKKTTYTYEIVIKNNRKAPITVDVEDQLPVSQSSDITVDAIEISKAELNPLTGKLKWALTLAAGESKKINLSYSVKYPRNKNIEIKKYRTISCPTF
jgi:uncharacterized protein (TIGR02231 family)